MEDIVQICDTNQNKAIHEKYNEFNACFRWKIEAIIDEYGKRAIKDYPRFPLKSLVDNLACARLDKYINQVCD